MKFPVKMLRKQHELYIVKHIEQAKHPTRLILLSGLNLDFQMMHFNLGKR